MATKYKKTYRGKFEEPPQEIPDDHTINKNIKKKINYIQNTINYKLTKKNSKDTVNSHCLSSACDGEYRALPLGNTNEL